MGLCWLGLGRLSWLLQIYFWFCFHAEWHTNFMAFQASANCCSLISWSRVHICLCYGSTGALSLQVLKQPRFSSDCVCWPWDVYHLIWGLRLWSPIGGVTVQSRFISACALCMRLVRQVIFSFTKLNVDLIVLTYSPRPPHLLMSWLVFIWNLALHDIIIGLWYHTMILYIWYWLWYHSQKFLDYSEEFRKKLDRIWQYLDVFWHNLDVFRQISDRI